MNNSISKKPVKLRLILIFLFMLLPMLVIDFPLHDTPNIFIVKDAEAIVGRPVTPGSVGGVRRRTRRRTAAVVGTAATATAIAVGTRVHTLPAGCATVLKGSVTYHHCGGVYYRPYYEGNTLVYVVENP